MTYEDQIQYGHVVHVGLREEPPSPLKSYRSQKTSQSGSVDIRPGGVIGDYHFHYELTNERPQNLKQYSQLETLAKKQGGKIINTHQVSLFEYEQIEYLRSLGPEISKLQPGWLGENITTQGIRLNEIRHDSMIVVNGLRLRVKARRNFCAKFFVEIPETPASTKKIIRQNINDLGELQVGILCQVLDAGTISNGNAITVYPNEDLVGQPWKNLPQSGWLCDPGDRVEIILPNKQ